MILMLNCSYKVKDSNTQYFLELLKKELESENIAFNENTELGTAIIFWSSDTENLSPTRKSFVHFIP